MDSSEVRSSKGKVDLLIKILCAAAMSAALLIIAYQFDNKYTHPGSQAEAGTLSLSEQDLQTEPVIFLVDGWEIHRDNLLTPKHFAKNPPLPDEFVFIGQYGGLEGSDASRSPHGSATYRLTLAVPERTERYALELPEIFSAYKLYVNGELLEQFGEPTADSYSAQVGNSSATFTATSRIEIIIAVSDYSHNYSGMVYPPAFGTAAAVQALLATRLAVRAIVCGIAGFLGIFFLLLGLFRRHDRSALLFGLLCLCFLGYSCYPLVMSVGRVGLTWYGIENVCFALLLLLVCLLQRQLTGRSGQLGLVVVGLCGFVCVCALLRAVVPLDNLLILTLYSLLISFYKWMVALFLTVSTLRAAGTLSLIRRDALLIGVIVFDVALVMDRVLPLFEPIVIGWFLEIAGFVIVLSFGVALGAEIVQQYRDKIALEGQVASASRLVEMQRAYYPMMLEGVEEARRARHDLRHHLTVIQGLVALGDTQKLEDYLLAYQGGLDAMAPLSYSQNHIVDVILRHFATLAARDGVVYSVDAVVPEMLPLEDADLCALLSNLIENAMEACLYLAAGKHIDIVLKIVQSHLVILVENSFDGTLLQTDGALLSRKRGGTLEGVGTASVRMLAQKYGGSLTHEINGATFSATVLI
jgi:hypothetical protein